MPVDELQRNAFSDQCRGNDSWRLLWDFTDYIRALCDAVKRNETELHPALGEYSCRLRMKKRYLASERSVKTFDLNSPFMIVGERINPTGKKALQEQLRNQSFDMVNDFASEQEAQGASFLDINMGMSGIERRD